MPNTHDSDNLVQQSKIFTLVVGDDTVLRDVLVCDSVSTHLSSPPVGEGNTMKYTDRDRSLVRAQ